MDLDNEELKATRKLNGVAKESNIDKLIKLKEISKRFNNGTETIEDIMYYCRNYEIKFENGLELRVVEKRYFDKLVKRIKKLEEALLKVKDKNATLFITCRNSIPKQKVKDKINKYIDQKLVELTKTGSYTQNEGTPEQERLNGMQRGAKDIKKILLEDK